MRWIPLTAADAAAGSSVRTYFVCTYFFRNATYDKASSHRETSTTRDNSRPSTEPWRLLLAAVGLASAPRSVSLLTASNDTMADNESGSAVKELQDVTTGTTAAASSSSGPNTSSSSSSSSSSKLPLFKKLYEYNDLTVGDRLVNTYVTHQRPDSPKLHRQGFCVGFSGSYDQPKVKMLLDNGQQIIVKLGSVQKVAGAEVVFEGDPLDKELWFADFAEDVRGDLKMVFTELQRRATKIRKRIQQQKKLRHEEQQQKEKKRQKMVEDNADASGDGDVTDEADSKQTTTAAPATAELSTEQKRERLALKRKRLELEVAQKKLAAAQAKATNAQKRSLLHKKKEQEKALAVSRQPTPVPGDISSKPPPRKKRKLTDLSALRRPAILVQNISTSGPTELVYIQPRQIPSNEGNSNEQNKSRLPTPQREEKKSELQKRQKEVMERRAELLRKAEMLKQKQRKSLGVEEEEEGNDEEVGDNDEDDAKVEADKDMEMTTNDDVDLDNEFTLRSGAASEAENDGVTAESETDQMEQLRLRRLELQSAISQQAQNQTELKQSIEVQNLRGMVRTQLGVLTKQGQNLSERTAQLKQCTADIESERKEVEDAERRFEELLEKKRRLETMAGTVTDKLLDSRKKKADILKGRVVDDGGPDAAAGGPLNRRRPRSPRQGGGGRQSRSKRNKGGTAADFF